MLNYLENLRKKPEAERKRKVFAISFVFTLIVAIIWGVSLFIYKKGMPEVKEGAASNVPSISDTFGAFGDQIQKIFNNNATYDSGSTSESMK